MSVVTIDNSCLLYVELVLRRTRVFKPWLHERFFACDGDVVFQNAASPACGKNCMCNHLHTGNATSLYFVMKNSTE